MSAVKKMIAISALGLFWMSALDAGSRLKDIAQLQGVRENQLVGYGLVVGLDGTGDGTSNRFTTQSLATMLNNLGVGIDPTQVNIKNVAAVIVTAYLPPFSRMGSKMDILVSSMGDAKSLQGGTLLLTPLKGADGKVYAVAQGPVTVGGFAAGAGGSSEKKNHPTVGTIPGGATIERELPFDFANVELLTYSLAHADFTTANRVARAINRRLRGSFASASDSGTVRVNIPNSFKGNVVNLVAELENMRIDTDRTARVVVNERTGTVVIGEDVRVSTIAIAHGGLTISIQPDAIISQPEPFSEGETVVVETPEVQAQEVDGQLAVIPGGVPIRDLVKALNAIGVNPRDLIAVFQAIQASGALQAELEII
jgi:flagellar P-ring protein precursor FlgI